MTIFIAIIFSVALLGILTTISPCPLATNIAAISFITKDDAKPAKAIYSSIIYALGRSLTYLVLSLIITSGLLGKAEVSQFLQKYMNEILGPILIVVGLILLKQINIKMPFKVDAKKIQTSTKKSNFFSTFFIGVLFALSFCPVSAGLFFGGLTPLILKTIQGGQFPAAYPQVSFPLIYGIFTSIPVILVALSIIFAAKYVEIIFKKLTSLETFFRNATGIIFVGVGIYYCLNYIFEAFV